ncbi:MAG: DUF1800 family protein [Verrucomicrobiales bacterium]|nr:DUF1800 family protein [Verrucomicrobiales bacterium]
MKQRCILLACLAATQCPAALDLNGNGLSDVWEAQFQAQNLPAVQDADGDGFSNAAEAIAGTNPFLLLSRPELGIQISGGNQALLSWPTVQGKRFQLLAADHPAGPWTPLDTRTGTGNPAELQLPGDGHVRQFFRIGITDPDSDADGLSDGEEAALGFNPSSPHTDRYATADLQRVEAGWNAASVVTVAVLDAEMSERWPDPAVLAVRRSGGMQPVTVHFTISGSAARGTDYAMPVGDTITIPAGCREVWIACSPLADALDAEGDETITLTVVPGDGYSLGAPVSGTATLHNEIAAGLPGAKAAARFLVQAAFGPDQDSAADPDMIPENVEAVMAQGFGSWLDAQFAIAPQYHEPFVAHAASIPEMYLDPKEVAWWNRALGTAALYPGGPAAQHDPLRQRMAFALSQIFVVSDRPETLAVEYQGMANYYDLLVRNAFGNFRTLLFDVATHPVMGFYLTHVKNRKANPAAGTFPDENFAREVMQLFSIGLWELNADGTRRLDAQHQPIPTYTNQDITQFARAFTGLSYGPAANTNFDIYPNPPQWIVPMRGFDAHHDLAEKHLLRGTILPARVASNPDTGAATLLDVHAAIDNLFNHPNVGPFIGRQLIQRLVTSNPSPAYVGRVAAAYADDGAGVRGNLKAVIKAILLDPEARDGAKLSDPAWGKAREPFLRCVNYARAFNAKPAGVDFYQLDAFQFDQQQEPYKSPSVFNFYLPNYSPPGLVGEAGLFAPEFQILNATTAVSSPNYFYNSLADRDLHRWGTADPARTVRPNFTAETALAAADIDALIRRLDLHLTCGLLSPREFQIIREAVARVDASVSFNWQAERVNLAVYLMLTSPEFCILR